MAQTNQPIGSSPLAQQGQVWRGPPPGQAIPQGPMSLGGAIGPYQGPSAMNLGNFGSPGSSTGVAQTPNNAQLVDQLRAQMGTGKPMPQMPLATGLGTPSPPAGGGTLSTLRPPTGAPGTGPGGGKGAGGAAPGMTPQMKQQVGQLPGGPPPGAPGQGAAGKGAAK